MVIDAREAGVFVGRMFIIIGGDGREYGPAGVDQVRGWISAGRANLETKAKKANSGEWCRLGDFPEFGGAGLPPVIVAGGAVVEAPQEEVAELAGIGARTGAALFNAFLYFLSTMPGSFVTSRMLLEKNPQLADGGIPRIEELDLSGMTEGVGMIWIGLLAAMGVQALLLTLRGQNLGMMLAGIRVVRADTGGPAGFARGALMRFLMPVSLVIMLNGFFLLGFLFLFVDYAFMFREDRRCLHDLIAGTKVVRV